MYSKDLSWLPCYRHPAGRRELGAAEGHQAWVLLRQLRHLLNKDQHYFKIISKTKTGLWTWISWTTRMMITARIPCRPAALCRRASPTLCTGNSGTTRLRRSMPNHRRLRTPRPRRTWRTSRRRRRCRRSRSPSRSPCSCMHTMCLQKKSVISFKRTLAEKHNWGGSRWLFQLPGNGEADGGPRGSV
jgi:hypothetical protein